MLHENAKQRLWRMVPKEYDLEWFDPIRDTIVSKTLTLDPARQIRWARQGSAIEYPCVYLNITPQGEPRGDMDHMFGDGIVKVDHPDPEVAYTKYSIAPLYATFTVTVAVDSDYEGIPERVVADEIATDVWHEYRFEAEHLEEMGVDPDGNILDYAWPMGLHPLGTGMDDTSRMLDEQPIERRQFSFRVDYAYFNQEDIPATKALEWTFGIDNDWDGEAEVTTGPYRSHWLENHFIPWAAEAECDAPVPTITTD